jgi:hypothetical protein
LVLEIKIKIEQVELKETKTSAFRPPDNIKFIEQEAQEGDADSTEEIEDKPKQQLQQPPQQPATHLSSSNSSSSSYSFEIESEAILQETALVDSSLKQKAPPSSLLNNRRLTDLAKSASSKKILNYKKGATGRFGRGKDEDEEEEELNKQKSEKMCCTKKFVCVSLIAIYVFLDAFLNIFFVTKSFSMMPTFNEYDIRTSLIDVWFVAIVRDFLLIAVLAILLVRHQTIYKFVRFVHRKYITAFLCLIMYASAMGKMLLHADKRVPDRINMIMLIWNIAAAFLFFISFYLLSLLKVKKYNYQKTDIDGGDLAENGGEEDIFIGNCRYLNLYSLRIRI